MKSRRVVVSREAKKKQHARTLSGLRDNYSKLFKQITALNFKNAIAQPLLQISLSILQV